ncbi:hypothetical protein BDF20DRAFT_163930 [Mycotypha africana]|uniref:uncharacterized protein n=1 Tax=Mycotypha africana TaxID=64632 RepID=UPI002300530D|nr:uncharacterized protein BDF20DRAFT_163930 [Mycotypha africana]KAI8968156.1 hypothetical protein BDF20DRAFT_163930 [Mycotypha africana]
MGQQRKETYFINGIGNVATDGSIFDQKHVSRKPMTEAAKTKLKESLKGRMDAGAKNIRKALGIKEEIRENVLSNEQLVRLGQQAMCSPEEEEQKKRSIEALTKRRRIGKEKPEEEKPRYVYL